MAGSRKKTVKSVQDLKRQYMVRFYNKFRNELPVREGTVFYHAYRTRIMAGNPYAIFLELKSRDEYKHFQHYWLYSSEEQLSYDTFSRFADDENVHYVKFGSEQHLKALASCEYYICNAAMPDYWVKRDGQVYINTWHGTPLKALGKAAKDMKESSVSNARRNFFMCDYMVMPNTFTRNALFDSYDLDGLTRAKVINAGYPRNDLPLKADRNRIRSLIEDRVGHSLADKKVLLYAPTFRSVDGDSLDTAAESAVYISQLTESLPEGCEVFFKVHNTLSRYYANDKGMSGHIILDEIETNELLAATDILITDYSSIFFDYLCTGKPCLFFMYDKEEYQSDRGLYLDVDTLPGRICCDVPELVSAIGDIMSGAYDESSKYSQFVKEYAACDDGSASRRVVDIIFGGVTNLDSYIEDPKPVPLKKKLINLGVTSDAVNVQTLYHVLDHIDYSEYMAVVCCDGMSRISRECARISPNIRLCSSKISEDGVSGDGLTYEDYEYKRYFWDNEFDEFIEIDDTENELEAVFANRGGIRKTAVINNTKSTLGFARKWRDVYKKIYVMGENAAGNLLPEVGEDADESRDTLEDISNVVLIPSAEIRSRDPRRLTVLFMSSFDSMNSVFAELIMELERRGHRAIVAVVDKNDVTGNKYYDGNGIEYYSHTEIRAQLLNYVDIAVMAPLLVGPFKQMYRQLKARNVFAVSFASLFSSVAMRAFVDTVLCIGETKVDEFRRNGLNYNFIVAGNPQYDPLTRCRVDDNSSAAGAIKKVLVIDQGGYPFGAKGKSQLAETLTDIALNNPDITFDIKPRYPKSERGMTLHSVSDHLVDYFGDMPSNLSFIEKPGMLEEIVPEYDAMICTWSTAYLDAVVYNIPLLLIEGFDSVDVFDVRTHRVQEAYNHLRNTGCLYHYLELRGKPLEFSYADHAYAEREVYRHDKESAPAIVTYFEQVKEKLLLNGLRHNRYFVADVDTPFDKQSQGDESIPEYKSVDDENYPAFRTYRYELNRFMQEMVFQNRCMGNVLDMGSLASLYYAPEPEPIPRSDLGIYIAELRDRFRDIRQDLVSAYFESPEGMALAASDKIIQDYYFDWLFNSESYDRLLKPDVPLLAPESREYNLARFYLKRRRYFKAFSYLGRFIDSIKASEHEMQLAKSKRMRITTRPFRRGVLIVVFAAYFLLTRRYSIFESVKDATVSGSAGLTLFRMKDMNARGQYSLSEQAFEQYMDVYEQKTRRKKRGGLKRAIRNVKKRRRLKRAIRYIRNKSLKLVLRMEYKRTQRLKRREHGRSQLEQ